MRAVAVDTLPEHLVPVIVGMRKADVDEVWAAVHHTPAEAVEYCVENSTFRKTIMLGEDPIAVYGIVPASSLSDIGIPWLLGTERMKEIRIQFVKETRQYVQDMLLEFPHLVNYVDVRNKMSIRWLKFLGFEFSEAEPFGMEGLPFHKFEMRRS